MKFVFLAVAVAAAPVLAGEDLNLRIGTAKDLNLRVYGFVETDVIADTTQGFSEAQGNSLVPPPNAAAGGPNFAGRRHRTELSVRNSRLGFDFTAPESDSGLKTAAKIELDFLGNQGPNTAPGATPGAQSEAVYFDSPTARVRHAYVDLADAGWDVKIGQTWSLLGWQPIYFTGESAVMPTPGELYQRFPQVRATRTLPLRGDWTIEAAADAAKPAEMNSGSPDAHAGLRLASTGIKAASLNGADTTMVGLSAAVSAALVPLATNGIGDPTGEIYAFDFAVPLIASRDGKERAGNLLWIGEYMNGSGAGGLELTGLSLGVPGIAAATPGAGSSIDPGIAGVNLSGNAELIRYQSLRSHLQYSPNDQWAFSAGYAQIEGLNLSHFARGTAAYAIAPKIQYGYVSAFYDALRWLRFGAELNQTRCTYNDPGSRFATNNRFQFSAYFIF